MVTLPLDLSQLITLVHHRLRDFTWNQCSMKCQLLTCCPSDVHSGGGEAYQVASYLAVPWPPSDRICVMGLYEA